VLDPDQLGSELLEVLHRFRDEGLQVLVGGLRMGLLAEHLLHHGQDSSPRNGLTMKSVAPASIASITGTPAQAEHMITTARVLLDDLAVASMRTCTASRCPS